MGAIFTSFILVTCIGLYASQINIYDLNFTVDGEGVNFTGVYDKINESYDLVGDIKDSTMDTEMESGDQVIDSGFRGGVKAVRLAYGSVGIVGAILNAVTGQLGLFAWILTFFVTIISGMFIFGLIYMYFRYRP